MTAISSTPEIRLSELKPWLEKETTDILGPLKGQRQKLLDKVTERIEATRDASEKLDEEGSKQLEKGKAVRKAKLTQKLSRFFLKHLDKIVFPEDPSFSELEGVHGELEKTMSSIMRERNRWFPRISPLFIIARRRVDFAIARLVGSISELGAFISADYQTAKAVENLFSATSELERLSERIRRFQGRRTTMATKVESLQKRVEEIEQQAESIRQTDELSSLAEARDRTAELKRQAAYELRHLEKPLSKFANLPRGPKYAISSEEAEKMEQYLENPFAALATEKPGHPVLKSLLRKVGRAMDDGQLKLKSSRLRKGRSKINEILGKDVLAELYQNCVQTYSTRQQLASSTEAKAAQTESRRMQRELTELQKQREAASARLATMDKTHQQLLEKARQQETTLEKQVSDVTGQQIAVKLF